MGIESSTKQKVKRERIQDIALTALYGAAVAGAMLAAPNVLKLLGKIDIDFRKKRNPAYRVHQAITRLIERKMLARTKKGQIVLTAHGEKRARTLYETDRLMHRKKERWDGRWRIVLFDVWEKRRKVRDQLRRLLQRIGFVRIQDSVWAYPYECEELVVFLRAQLRLGTGIIYLIAEGIEGDKRLKRYFDLE